MPANDPRIAEITRVKNKITEVEVQLKEQKKIAMKLRDNTEKRFRQIAVLDSEIIAELERYRWKREEKLLSSRTLQNEAAQKLEDMLKHQNHIMEQTAGFDVLEYENHKLHARLKEAASARQNNAHAQTREWELKKQKNFDTRMAMEESFRKLIKNFDSDYQADAIAKMEKEASLALVENNMIYTEFFNREEKCERLVQQQQKSYDKLMRLRIERDVIAVSTDIQEQSIADLSQSNDRLEKEVVESQLSATHLRERIQRLKDAREEQEHLAVDLLDLKAQLSHYCSLTAKVRNLSLGVCNKAVEMSLEIHEQNSKYQSVKIAERIGNIKLDAEDTPPPTLTRSRSRRFSFLAKQSSTSSIPMRDIQEGTELAAASAALPISRSGSVGSSASEHGLRNSVLDEVYDPTEIWRNTGNQYYIREYKDRSSQDRLLSVDPANRKHPVMADDRNGSTSTEALKRTLGTAINSSCGRGMEYSGGVAAPLPRVPIAEASFTMMSTLI